MNELEKTGLPEEQLSAPEAPVQQEATTQSTVEETATPQADEPATPEAVKEDPRRYHNMSKQELVEALANILETGNMQAHKDVAAIKQSFYVIRNKETEKELDAFVEAGNEPMAFAAMPDADEARFKELLAEFRERRNAFLEAEEERKKENLVLKQQVLAKLQALVEDIDNVNLRFQEFQTLQQEFKDIKEVPASSETEIWKAYQKVVEQFYDHLKMNKELRDLAFKKNLEAKQALIAEAQGLLELDDVVAASRRLQDLHVRWKDLGPVDKSLRDEIWEQFRAASAAVNRRHQDYMIERKAKESANEEGKTRLCEEVEAISGETYNSFSAWDAAAKKIQELQAEWRTFGFASRKVNNQLYARFRKACDDFFGKRSEYFKNTREQSETNLARKTALCVEVESLRQIDDLNLHEAIEKIQKLQAEWKTIGPVPRKYSDQLWERFSSNCNYFFDLRKQRSSETRKAENANLTLKTDIIARLKAIPKDIDRQEAREQINALRDEWASVGHVPMRVKDRIYKEFRAAINELYEAFNITERRNRLSNFEDRVKSMGADNNRLSKEENAILRQLEAKRNDLKTYENNLGFFNIKSSAGNSMLQEMERKAARIKDEIAELEQKLKMLKEAPKAEETPKAEEAHKAEEAPAAPAEEAPATEEASTKTEE